MPSPEISPSRHVGRRVLLAEDDTELRSLLQQVLQDDGYEVTALEDGLALFYHMLDLIGAGRQRPDVIISDVLMPGIMGLDVVRYLRTAGAEAPIIFITAFPSDETRQEAERLGAYAMLSKPFDIDELRVTIEEVLEKAATQLNPEGTG